MGGSELDEGSLVDERNNASAPRVAGRGSSLRFHSRRPANQLLPETVGAPTEDEAGVVVHDVPDAALQLGFELAGLPKHQPRVEPRIATVFLDDAIDRRAIQH